DGVLLRITEAARELSGASYAALGIPDGHGSLEKFIPVGMTEEQIQRMDHHPVGEGLIGEMLRRGESIRLDDLSHHPKSAGFPAGHPPMRSFLGVPISAYGNAIGQLYLTEKQGGAAFTEEDQRLIEMLASHAAAAIENARLYRQVLESEKELSQRNEELELFNTLATAVSSALELDELLESMLPHVMERFGAEAGEVFLREEGTSAYRLALLRGDGPRPFWELDHFHLGEGFVGGVALAGKPAWTDNLADEPRFLSPAMTRSGFESLVGVPLTARGQVVGVLDMAFRSPRRITAREAGLLEAVGAGVGVAADNARLYRDARRLAVLEERERIGMDLHDGIIQSIYAVGLNLESARLLFDGSAEKAKEMIPQAIDALNATIRDIRNYILDLQPSRIPTGDLAKALARLVREFRANTLSETDLQLEAAALVRLTPEVSTSLFMIAQEALANVAKHARASRAWVSLRMIGGGVCLQIIDNGLGFDAEHSQQVLGHGMSNMASRARHIDGALEVVSEPGEGTTLTVRLPEPGPDLSVPVGTRSADQGPSFDPSR
ncbi:MAG: GAF domain-containing sensor histidine kinase, partial [Anaerolineales bacterium]|nr:GAF domain-containing sensor histidine kinase [Anaerolineales bacterium]